MDKRTLEIVKEYINSVSKNYSGFTDAYIFGSFAKKKEADFSDIDVAIIMDKINDRFDLQVELMLLAAKYDLRIEPHPISQESFTHHNSFANEIKKYGIKLT
jgi:predicted nucleotidyltransferase